MDAELKKRSDVLQSEIDNLNEQFASIWTDEGSKKQLTYEEKAQRVKDLYQKAAKLGGGYSSANV